MNQVKVPKYLDIEDKVVGPLTLRQFFLLGGSAALGFVLWQLIPVKFIALFAAGIVVLLGAGIAFVRVNERPFQEFLFASIRFYMNPQKYVWQKVQPKVRFESEPKKQEPQTRSFPVASSGATQGILTRSKIRELAEKLELQGERGETSMPQLKEEIRKRDY